MIRCPSPFRERDITRALKGARAAGIEVARVEIEKDGKIVISTPSAPAAPVNPYDAWKTKLDAS